MLKRRRVGRGLSLCGGGGAQALEADRHNLSGPVVRQPIGRSCAVRAVQRCGADPDQCDKVVERQRRAHRHKPPDCGRRCAGLATQQPLHQPRGIRCAIGGRLDWCAQRGEDERGEGECGNGGGITRRRQRHGNGGGITRRRQRHGNGGVIARQRQRHGNGGERARQRQRHGNNGRGACAGRYGEKGTALRKAHKKHKTRKTKKKHTFVPWLRDLWRPPYGVTT